VIRRNILMILAALLCLLTLSSCNLRNHYNYDENFAFDYPELRQDGEIFFTTSNKFKVTVFPTEIIMDEYGYRRMSVEFSVDNNSLYTFHGLTVSLDFEEWMDMYLAAGAVGLVAPLGSFDIGSRDSLGSSHYALGVNARMRPLILTNDQIEFLGIDYDIVVNIMQYAQEYTIRIAWRGGEEYIRVTSEVIDKT